MKTVPARRRGALRERAGIVGVGYTGFSKNSGVSTLTLALRAIRAALDDAGLSLGDVDGVATHRVGDSVPAGVVAHSLGIQDLRYHLDVFGGGSAACAIVASAAMAVASGAAECVVCWRALNARSEFRMGGTGRAAPDAVEFQYQAPYGLATPPQLFALVARAWMDATGASEEDLGHVAIAERRWAADNERAMMRSPLDLDAYLASRFIAEPLRLYDCCLETDAGVALVVTSAERARALRQPPVLIRAAAHGGGHNLYSNRRGDLTRSGAALLAPRLFAAAGIERSDVDLALLYDAYTPLVLMQLEDYGFCARGASGSFVRAGETALGGALPVNTHGGFLSEGYAHGLNHVAEGVAQLRGSCGARQVAGAELALVTSQPGYVSGLSSALILGRGGR